MKIAMLGGTFDPIHNGHLAIGHLFADLLGLESVIIVPTKIPPHKSKSTTPAGIRLEMCRLAAGETDGVFSVSDIEIRREGLSWTFYTVTSLMELYPGSEFYLICGADMFMTLESWHRFHELKTLVTFCSVPREDITAAALKAHAGHLERLGCRTFISDSSPIPISSTVIRKRVCEGKDIIGLVPAKVEEYIIKNRLYLNADE